ncbi:MAG: glycosyltransferase family 2 protein [Actinomycetota bacterium]|nr:glycosyltransferase family 2 protein [Actinomycetota bacterium]
MDLSYCIVNTDGRDLLLACLDAIARTHPPGLSHEILVLDNSSDDGSAAAVQKSRHDAEVIALDRRRGKAENDSHLLRVARGAYCLLLNEDSELCEGATAALLAAMEADPSAGAAGAQLLSTDGEPKPCAWRLPGIATAVAGALFLHRSLTVQSGGARTREVGWAQSSAMLVRSEAAAQVGYLDPAFFVYSDETDFCKRLHDAGWKVLHVPSARAIHHDQLTTDFNRARRRIVEFHRGRDRYLRKHASAPERLTVRLLGAWFYLALALVAAVAGGHDARRYLLHARQELTPLRGEGISEAAEEYNRRARIAP